MNIGFGWNNWAEITGMVIGTEMVGMVTNYGYNYYNNNYLI
jgi:hypothetical protein